MRAAPQAPRGYPPQGYSPGFGYQQMQYPGTMQPTMQQQQPMQPGMRPMQPSMHPGMQAMPMHPGMAPQGQFMPQDLPQGNGMNQPYSNGYPSSGGTVPMGSGMNPYSQQFVPQPNYQQQPPPTDEEQEWLEQQMMRNQPAAKISEDVPEVQVDSPAPSASSEAGGYDDVMKMIEENRKKNEAKRAAQSARNAEIIAAYEARMGAQGPQG